MKCWDWLGQALLQVYLFSHQCTSAGIFSLASSSYNKYRQGYNWENIGQLRRFFQLFSDGFPRPLLAPDQNWEMLYRKKKLAQLKLEIELKFYVMV